MGIISSSGESKSKAFEALKAVRNSDYDLARQLLKESQEADVEAHNIQTLLIQKELSDSEEERTPMSLLMVHAQDQYMSSALARDLIEELVKIFEEKNMM
ncbi:PTS lactose/cellobiose transporter subunit IIA [Lactovum odontotermitis]